MKTISRRTHWMLMFAHGMFALTFISAIVSALVNVGLRSATTAPIPATQRNQSPTTLPLSGGGGGTVRIATLAPALSQMLVDMGKADQIVGVAQFDASAPPGLPIVGSYMADINAEALLASRATMVLNMAGSHAAPTDLLNLRQNGIRVITFPSPQNIEEVSKVLSNPNGTDSLESVFKDGSALRIQHRMMARLTAILRLTATLNRPKALLVIGTDPLTAMGPRTVLGELLDIGGGTNAATHATVNYATYDREAVLGLRPDAILLLMPGGPALQPGEDDPRLAAIKGLGVPAVADHRIYLLNDPLILLPSSNIPRVAAQIAKVLHPDLTARIDAIMADANPDGKGP